MRIQSNSREADLAKGVMLIVCASAFFSLLGVFVRLSGDLPTMQKSLFRNAVALLISGAVLRKASGRITFRPKSWKLLFARAGFGTLGILCNFYAIDRIHLADANALNKLSPLFLVLFSSIAFKEKCKSGHILILLGAFAGSLLIIRPVFQMEQTLPYLIGMLGGASVGAAFTAVRGLAIKQEPSMHVVFFFSAFSTAVCLPFVLLQYRNMTLVQAGYLLLAGVCAAIGQLCATYAYRFVKPYEVSAYDYTQVLFSIVWGYVFFGQQLDYVSTAGYFIVISMGIAMFLYNRKNLRGRAAAKYEVPLG